MPTTDDAYAAARDDADRLRALTGQEQHDVAVVLGSGWTPAIEQLTVGGDQVPYTELAHFPPPSARVDKVGTAAGRSSGACQRPPAISALRNAKRSTANQASPTTEPATTSLGQ